MCANGVRLEWREPHSTGGFQAGVCLHGHTLHSEECLNFLPRSLDRAPGISQIVRYYERVRRVDFGRAWWTPPLTPASALDLERKQIAGLGLRPIVSLTDHDNIEAGLALGVTADPAETPVSVEWTVPYERSIFHLGLHNLPAASARGWMEVLARYTAEPRASALPGLLAELSRVPGILIVLNHPFWLEEGVAEADHPRALESLLGKCARWFDAMELNGTRRWKENADALELARRWSRPVISGGDRHGCEPAAAINLTNARSFDEFAAEIREGRSTVLFMPQYREPMAQRVLEAARDILRTYPEYPGRERWADRIFYRGDDGVARSLTEIWSRREPRWLEAARSVVELAAESRFRPAMRLFLAERRGAQSVKDWRLRCEAALAEFTPEQAALLLSVGLVLGVFPIIGLPTVFCLIAAFAFRLNGAALLVVNQASSPLQFALLLPLARLGERLCGGAGAAHLGWTGRIGAAAFDAVAGWACVCVPAGALLYLVLMTFARRCFRQARVEPAI